MIKLPSVLCVLVLGTAACGGGDGDGDSPVTPAQATELCAQSCDFDAECQPDDVDPTCQSQCEAEAVGTFSYGATKDYLDCVTVSCDASEDACILDLPIRADHTEYETACNAFMTMCEIDDSSTCDLTEPEGGAFLRLLTPESVTAATACFDATCEDLETVGSCLDAAFGFGDA